MIGDGSQNSVERSDAQCFVGGNSDTMRSRFIRVQHDVAADLVDLLISPATAHRGHQFVAGSSHEGFSSDGEHFISDEMQPDACWLRAVKVERLHSFLDIGPQFAPRASLRKNALGETLGTKAAVCVLCDLEYDFVHALTLRDHTAPSKWQSQ